MAFVRQPIIKNEVRDEILKPKLTELWNREQPVLTANEIAEKLEFGVPETTFEKLKPYHVWFYRSVFNLPPRREREKGGSRYKHKQEKIMSWQTFLETLDKKLDPKLSFCTRRQRSYLILHYWTPLRKSEIYERTINDFEIEGSFLVIHLLRKKKKYPKNKTDEPLSIPLAFPKMSEVVEWFVNREWMDPIRNPLNRPWNISHQTAWEWVQEIFPGYYPHFFRFNSITIDANDPETSIVQLKAKTGLHLITINTYLMSAKRQQEDLEKRRLKQLTEEGADIQPLTSVKEITKIPILEAKKEPPKKPIKRVVEETIEKLVVTKQPKQELIEKVKSKPTLEELLLSSITLQETKQKEEDTTIIKKKVEKEEKIEKEVKEEKPTIELFQKFTEEFEKELIDSTTFVEQIELLIKREQKKYKTSEYNFPLITDMKKKLNEIVKVKV